MTLAEGTPANWSPGSFPMALQLGGHAEHAGKDGDRPALPVVHWPAGPVKLPVPGGAE